MVAEGRVLNRVIRWTEAGWEMEPGQRHVDRIVRELNLEDARGVSTPGESEARGTEEENGKPLNYRVATIFEP